MPRRCISRTTSRPNSVSPPAAGVSVAESAQGRFRLWVSVMYRTPSWYKARKVPSEQAIEWPPSAPISEASLPAAVIRSHIVGGQRELQRVRVARDQLADQVDLLKRGRDGASPCSSAGTYTDQNWAPTPPLASRGRSVWVKSTGAAISVLAGSSAAGLAQRPGQVVVPVDQREPVKQRSRRREPGGLAICLRHCARLGPGPQSGARRRAGDAGALGGVRMSVCNGSG